MTFDTIGAVILAYQKCRLFGRGGHGLEFGLSIRRSGIVVLYYTLKSPMKMHEAEEAFH
jgi:hypothetical protein